MRFLSLAAPAYNPDMAKKRKDPESLLPLRLEYVEAASLQDNDRNWRTHPAAQLEVGSRLCDWI
jgi:hypothetical protein